MELEESVKWIDDRVFAKTGKRLNSIQISILEATLQGKKYPKIAEEYNFTTDHVRKAGWKLWKLLSDVLYHFNKDVVELMKRDIEEKKCQDDPK